MKPFCFRRFLFSLVFCYSIAPLFSIAEETLPSCYLAENAISTGFRVEHNPSETISWSMVLPRVDANHSLSSTYAISTTQLKGKNLSMTFSMIRPPQNPFGLNYNIYGIKITYYFTENPTNILEHWIDFTQNCTQLPFAISANQIYNEVIQLPLSPLIDEHSMILEIKIWGRQH